MRTHHEHGAEDAPEEFLGDAAEQRRRAAPAMRCQHHRDLGVSFDLVADDLSDALGRHANVRGHRDTRGVVLLQAFGDACFGIGGVVPVEDDLDQVDRGIAASSERYGDISSTPRRIGSVDGNDQVLDHGDSLR